MCGIAGIIKKKGIDEQDQTLVKTMNALLAHRGPNGEGYFSDTHVSMAMRRLSIIDLQGGQQPLYNEDGSIVLIANGEIYNFVELRETLTTVGHHFKTGSDCETIIHAYEEYGKDFLTQLRGMFAFCLYDSKRKVVIIARDRLGEKPLYIHETETGIAFASEMKSIIACIPREDRRIDEQQLYTYLHYGYVPEPRTLMQGIRKLPAGSVMRISLDPYKKEETEYWNYSQIQTQEETPEKLVRRELEAIEKIIIRSDVPVGVALSGGIDSSLVAVLSAQNSKDRLHAFSVGYPGYPENDERLQAKKLADDLGLVYHPIEITKEEFLEDFAKLVRDMDDPIADMAAYGYYRIAREARAHNVPVVLMGFGGDELFWGYQWVVDAVRLNILKQTLLGKCKVFYMRLRNSAWGVRHNFFPTVYQCAQEAFGGGFLLYDTLSAFRRISLHRRNIFEPTFLRSIDQKEPESLFNKADMRHPAIAANEKLHRIWLYSNSLALGDRTTMAHSIESRLPLLDYKLVEQVFGIHKARPTYYEHGLKHALIEATKDLLPAEITSRKKRGFNPPSAQWMQAVITEKEQLLRTGYLATHHILQSQFIDETIQNPSKHQELLYRLTLVETWIQAYLPNI